MSTFKNFVQCRAASPITSVANSIGLYAAEPPYTLPSEEGGLLVLADSPTKPSKLEVISYTSRSELGLYGVTRGLEGTTALEWVGPVYCYQSLLAGEFKTLLDSKVDKVAGKQLSDENYTLTEKQKLGGIADEATKNRADSENADEVHTHTWDQVNEQPVTATRWPTFDEVTSKPSSFTPASHTHPWAQVTGAPDQATRWPTFAEVTSSPATATRWPTWEEVSGKPTTVAPTAHTHTWDQVTGIPIVQTVGTSTTDLMSQKAITDALGNIGEPTMTSDAVLVHTDNSIAATGIVTKLGLEIGDVIEVDNDNLQSGYFKPLGQVVGDFYQFATKGNDVYVAGYSAQMIMKQTNGEGLFKKIEGVPALGWIGICFIGDQMYASVHSGRIYSVDEATGAVDIVSPTNQNWFDITTDGTHIYGCMSNSAAIYKVDPIAKTQEVIVPTSPHADVRGLVYSPIDNSLYIGASGATHPIRKLVNMTGPWIDVSTVKGSWSMASYYNGKVYFSDVAGQVWKENEAGDDFELFSKIPLGSPSARGGNIIVNDMLYKTQLKGDIYTSPIIKKDLFTVESIVSDDKIIVNDAHAFGAGSKSLWHQTLSAAKFTRIAKWHNAPTGLGQAWVDMTRSMISRVNGVDYTNLSSRAITHSIYIYISSTKTNTYRLGGISINMTVTTGGACTVPMSNPVHSGSSYGVSLGTGTSIRRWMELR